MIDLQNGTVGELINALKQFPEDAIVEVLSDINWDIDFATVTRVYKHPEQALIIPFNPTIRIV